MYQHQTLNLLFGSLIIVLVSRIVSSISLKTHLLSRWLWAQSAVIIWNYMSI